MSATSHAITGLVIAAVLGGMWRVLSWAARTGRYPRVEEPPAETRPRGRDRFAYAGAVLFATSIGAAAGSLLLLVPDPDHAPALFTYSNFAVGGHRWIGPAFLAMGVVGELIWPITARTVRAEALAHFLWRQARFGRGADPRPITRWLARAVCVAAIAVHFVLRAEHTTLDADGVRWCDGPWHKEQVRPWSEVREVRIVRQLIAAAGNVVDREHLGIEFADGTVVHAGMRAYEQPGFWERPARIAGAHAAVPVHRVERD